MQHIANFNQRITFQKYLTVVDENANHTTDWTDYYTCYAYASTFTGSESNTTGVTETKETVTFTVRCCSELAKLNTTQYRIKFNGNNYNITSIDRMNYKNEIYKIQASKEQR